MATLSTSPESHASSTDAQSAAPTNTNPNFPHLPEGVTGTAFQAPTTPTGPVPLSHLKPQPETIQCPHCHKTSQTRVVGRSKGKERFMNVFWWPMPGRRHWWEKTEWFCGECEREVARQKFGKEIEVVGTPEEGA